MKRDFKEEYENYINENKVDLWSRIEAELPEKDTQNIIDIPMNKKGSKKTITACLSAVATIAILCISIKVLNVNQHYESATQESTCEAPDTNGSLEYEYAGATDAPAEAAPEEECVEEELSETVVATLTNISVASANLQEFGFAYVYIFRQEDETELDVLVEQATLDELSTMDVQIERNKQYQLTVLNVPDEIMNKEPQNNYKILKNLE